MASLEVGSIQATLGANVSQFVSGMRQAQQSFNATTKTIQKGAVGIQQSSQSTVVSLKTIATSVQGLQRTVQRSMAAIGGAFILPKILGVAKSAIIDFNQQLDQSRIAFTHFAGGAEQAEKMLSELQEFAAYTPFNFKDLLGTTQQMMAMGVQADELIPRLTAIGDAAAALGGSPEVMRRIQRALGQIQAKGRVQAEELMQLAEVGVPAYQYIADIVGGSIPQALDKMKKGEIDAATAVSALLDGLARDFTGMMDSQSRTMMGAMSTVEDFAEMTVAELGRPLFDALRETMLKIANFLGSEEVRNGAKRMAQNFAEALKQIGDVVGQALKVIGPALVSIIKNAYEFGRALASGLDQIKPLILGVAGGFFVAIKAVEGIMNVLAPVVKLFAENKTLATALAVVLGTLALKSRFVGVNAEGQAKAFTRLASGMKTAIANVKDTIRYQKMLATYSGQTITSMQALKAGVVSGFKAMGLAVKGFMASLGPMLALIVAVEVAIKIFDAISNKNRDLKERMKELTSEIEANTTALLENAEALKEGATGAEILGDAILKTGDNGKKLTQAFGQLGKVANLEEFARAADNFEAYATGVLMAKGASADTAREMAQLIDKIDKGNTKMQIAAQATELGFTPAMFEAAVALEEIQDQVENINFEKLVQEQADMMVGSGQVSKAMQDKALAFAQAKAEAEGLGDAMMAVIYNQELMRLATDGARKAMQIQEQHTAEFEARLASLEKQQAKLTKTDKSAIGILRAMQSATKDGKVEMDDYIASVLGGQYATMEFERAMRSTRDSTNKMFDDLIDGEASFEDLKFASYDLSESLLRMVKTADALGIDQKEIVEQQQRMVAGFIATAKKAGATDEELRQLIKTLQVLGALDPTIQVFINIEDAKKQLDLLLRAFEGLGQAGIFVPEILDQIANVQAIIDEMGKPRGGGGGRGGGSAEDPFDWVKGWVEDIADYVDDLFSKDFADAIMSSTPERIGEIIADVVEEGMALGIHNLPGAENLIGEIMDLNKQMQEQALLVAEAQAKYDEAAAEVEFYEEQIKSLAEELKEFQRIEAGDLNALERLDEGIAQLEELRGALQSLQDEYEQFKKLDQADPLKEQIEIFNSLRSSLDSLVDSYNEFEQNVSGVQSPLEREIELLDELRSQYEDLTTARDDYQKSVTESLGTMKFEARGGVLGQARRYLGKVEAYKNIISGLKDRNFPPALIQEVLNSGLDAGSALGRKLLALSDADLSELLEVQKQISQMAADVGGIAADVLFTADVSEAEQAFKRQISVVRSVYQQAIADADRQFSSQRAVVDAMYQQQIAMAQQAFDQQKTVVEALYEAAIAEAEQLLADAKSVADGLKDKLQGVQDKMGELITALASAVNAITKGLTGDRTPSGGGGRTGGASGGSSTRPTGGTTSSGLPIVIGTNDQGRPTPGQSVGGPDRLWGGAGGGGVVDGIYIPDGIDWAGLGRLAGARAMGGPVSAGRMYMVGEVGPELFVPRASGTIVPNSALSGGKGSTYNITVNARGGSGDDIGRQVVKAIQEYERRNGKKWRD